MLTLIQKLDEFLNLFYSSIEQLFKTADHMYILPTHRLTVYIMGILLGYALRTQKALQLSKVRHFFKCNCWHSNLLVSSLKYVLETY